ncbi:hypothetical protein PVK06_017187 [Gossypium arboreum]|uniref:Uncharacterized protein n=1 Tax=Gossypium arboreum TaxID=29729 RepID=A0ABR0Q2U4_GOSAR|nr:hypothetical protein PVK06_017187 [Gossypium arboreum]
MEDNTTVRIWSEKTQEKGDSLTEEKMTLLHCPRIQADKDYSKAINVSTFLKKLKSLTGMSEQWVTAQIKQKGIH